MTTSDTPTNKVLTIWYFLNSTDKGNNSKRVRPVFILYNH